MYGFWKRFIDIALSLFLFVLSIPVCIFAAIGIYVEPRPVLYRSDAPDSTENRSGSTNSDPCTRQTGTSGTGSSQTPTGFSLRQFTRRTKIDEIPQLLNILKETCLRRAPPHGGKSVAEIYKGNTSPAERETGAYEYCEPFRLYAWRQGP